MTAADERLELKQNAEQGGWAHRDVDSVDIYERGTSRIRVIWGSDAINGASLLLDDIMQTYTRDLATVNGWLVRK